MTDEYSETDITAALLLSDAVKNKETAELRQLSSRFDSDFIQLNGSHTFLHTFIVLNMISGEDFPQDVWSAIPNEVIASISQTADELGCEEQLLNGMIASFLQQNAYFVFEEKEPKLLNPDSYSAGYFHIAVAVGEAVRAMLQVAADKRFDGKYETVRKLIEDYLLVQEAVRVEDEQSGV